MKTFKIYGTKYPLNSTTNIPAEVFAYKGELSDEPPAKGKMIGYVALEDGTVAECYKKFNVLIVLLPLLILLLGGAGFVVWLLFLQPRDVEFMGDIIKQGEDNNVITYSGFPSVRNSALFIQYQNGDYPAHIVVTGEGIETTETFVDAGVFVETIPCNVNSTEGLVEAFITVTTDTSVQTFPIVVELPENLNGNDSNEGMEGFWYGESIYGAPGANSSR